MTNEIRLHNRKEQVYLYPIESGDSMLPSLQTHSCYLSQLDLALAKIPIENIEEFKTEIQLFRILDFDPAHELIASAYSSIGRPAKYVIQLFRAFLFASREKLNIKALRKRLLCRPPLRALCGFSSKEEVPALGTFYHLIDRFVPINEKKQLKAPIGARPKKKDIGSDQKLPDKRSTARTTRLAEQIMDDKISLSRTPERLMQLIFSKVAVLPSIKAGLISENPVVSGDGTCLKTGASSYGVKTCDCRKHGIFRCKCLRNFSDPLANVGWDSHEKHWYYGYTAFFMTTYSKKYKKDLPLTVRLVDAKRHDSLTTMLALVDLRETTPEISVETFLGDSAMDCGAMYSLLDHFHIQAVIDLNHRAKDTSLGDIQMINHHPVCPAGLNMTYWGQWKRNMLTRIKYRCPAKTKKGVTCPLSAPCSPSDYGRTFYVHPTDDLRLFPAISRHSKKWRELYKQRSASERVIKQVLIDHGIEQMSVRSKRRNFFYIVMSCIDIHLKAQLSIQA